MPLSRDPVAQARQHWVELWLEPMLPRGWLL